MSARWRITPSRKRTDWLVVLGPKDEHFIAAIKRAIPANLRAWDSKLVAWLVHESRRADLERVIADHSHEPGA
jgi:hypothetical protein